MLQELWISDTEKKVEVDYGLEQTEERVLPSEHSSLECSCSMTPKTLPVFPCGLNNRGCSWPLLHRNLPNPPTHSEPDSGETVYKTGEEWIYWIKPLLTVLEYDGKNLGTQGGLCQQALFA